MTDRVTQAYLSDESLHGVMGRLDLPPCLEAAYGHRLVNRPFFLEEAVAHEIAADLLAFFELLLTLPRRFFNGSFKDFAAALGLPPEEAALMSADRPPLHGRADIYRDGDRFRLLEVNAGSQLGGPDLGELARVIRETPEFEPFADAHGLRHVNPIEKLLDAVGRDRTIAFLEEGGMLTRFARGFASFREACARQGVDVLLGELHEVTERNGHLHLGGTRLDAVIRYFSAKQAVKYADLLTKGHKTELYTPLSSYYYGNKSTLALLSERRAELTDAERALVDKLLPWTRYLRDVPRDEVRAKREDLIVKAAGEFAGTGIHPGWLLTDREWADLLDDVAGQPYVVQERVRPTTDVVPGDDRPWVTTWGWFFTDAGFAGMSIRAMPVEDGAVISYAGNPLTRVSGLLLY
ncbi:hypothetical protein [Saccharothrix syringae]|uniref:Glutathionylspermidine synthase pre-ATP-grasp-like domain-containing protein n=1 Tax=Saccharothrix syringae TaxID=103733 RepID=A0A5Q0HBT4_SACSY|nr:hypothetical protein [Saccharothrix syringae]QFZ23651.1 hypothetical protein EKG83_45000 [Saccharothrix syringae]